MIYGSKKENMINTNIYKMKTKLTLVLLIAVSFLTNAQSSEKCAEDLQYLVQFTKSKDYKDAYPYLQSMRKDCPAYHKAIYIYGEFILKDRIDNTQVAEEKEKEIKDLVALYGDHDKNFPNNGAGNTVKKAMLLLDNKVGTKEEAYAYLDNAFKTDAANFTSA